MHQTLSLLAVGILAYLAGSIPFGLVLGRVVAGVDIRTQGSGNIGATNVSRVLGSKWGGVVLLLDALKGLLPVWLLPRVVASSGDGLWPHVAVLVGVCTIVGHMFPCWLGFRGGKGVATSLGVVAVLAPWASLVAFGLFAVSFALFRIVSLSSILAAAGFAIWQMAALWPAPFSRDHWSLAAFSLLVPLLIVARHRSNLVRLMRGEEGRFHAAARPAAPPRDPASCDVER